MKITSAGSQIKSLMTEHCELIVHIMRPLCQHEDNVSQNRSVTRESIYPNTPVNHRSHGKVQRLSSERNYSDVHFLNFTKLEKYSSWVTQVISREINWNFFSFCKQYVTTIFALHLPHSITRLKSVKCCSAITGYQHKCTRKEIKK